MSYEIVQVGGGWTFVGLLLDEGLDDEYGRITLGNCALIHDWGADRGLGELCDGPATKTVLHPIYIVNGSAGLRIQRKSVRFCFEVSEEGWKRKLQHESPDNGSSKTAVLVQQAGGWSHVGLLDRESRETIVLQSPGIIHQWGAPMGLGQLVKGPTPEQTIVRTLQVSETRGFRIQRQSVRLVLDICASTWGNALGFIP